MFFILFSCVFTWHFLVYITTFSKQQLTLIDHVIKQFNSIDLYKLPILYTSLLCSDHCKLWTQFRVPSRWYRIQTSKNLFMPVLLSPLFLLLSCTCTCKMSNAANMVALEQTMSEMIFHVESKISSRTTAQYPANYKFTSWSQSNNNDLFRPLLLADYLINTI